jgi:phosphoserine phosphatase
LSAKEFMSYRESPRFLVVLDADSTLIHDEVIELLAEEAGSRELVADITARAMNGAMDFEESLRARVQTLRGVSSEVFERVGSRIRVTDGVTELVTSVQASGGRVGVVSGGFHEVLDPLAERLGLDHWRANRLVVRDGELSGEVSGEVVDAAVKARTLREWAHAAGIPLSQSIAVGDGANDRLMMDEAGLSAAFNAKQVVRDHADVVIAGQDLSQVLPLLGLRG